MQVAAIPTSLQLNYFVVSTQMEESCVVVTVVQGRRCVDVEFSEVFGIGWGGGGVRLVSSADG